VRAGRCAGAAPRLISRHRTPATLLPLLLSQELEADGAEGVDECLDSATRNPKPETLSPSPVVRALVGLALSHSIPLVLAP
jgi:hypothetical protein